MLTDQNNSKTLENDTLNNKLLQTLSQKAKKIIYREEYANNNTPIQRFQYHIELNHELSNTSFISKNVVVRRNHIRTWDGSSTSM